MNLYGAAQIQLHSQARVSSKALKGLLKVTHHKLCECLRFSTPSLVNIRICLSASYNLSCALVANALHHMVTPLWGCLLGFTYLLFNCAAKNFLVLRSNYTMEVCPVLHELFISKTGPKLNCLVDFFTTSLPTTHAYTHAHCCLLFKVGRETRPCD